MGQAPLCESSCCRPHDGRVQDAPTSSAHALPVLTGAEDEPTQVADKASNGGLDFGDQPDHGEKVESRSSPKNQDEKTRSTFAAEPQDFLISHALAEVCVVEKSDKSPKLALQKCDSCKSSESIATEITEVPDSPDSPKHEPIRPSRLRQNTFAPRRSAQTVVELETKRPLKCKLSAKAWRILLELYAKMDQDGANNITPEKAEVFFTSYKKVSAKAMFNELDTDHSESISAEEFMDFWIQVRASGYTEQTIMEEVELLMEGSAWVDWNDGRSTSKKEEVVAYPKRPMVCRLSKPVWERLHELFLAISCGKPAISRTNAKKFFKGAFAHVSAEAMFNEVDADDNGCINGKEWVKFWAQVKHSGYKDKDLMEEVEQLFEGGTWVDWKNAHSTVQ